MRAILSAVAVWSLASAPALAYLVPDATPSQHLDDVAGSENPGYVCALHYLPRSGPAVVSSLVLPAVIAAAAPVAGSTALILAPLGLSAGYAYAGAPLRGAAVGFGGTLAVLGGYVAGSALTSFALGSKANGLQVTGGIALSALAIAGYTVWALFDLHATADRERRALGAKPCRQAPR
ncbi:MAG: hypothetical protein KGR26_09915 [Cyanobacteria bacterium REEB65]|nr:hypothetical protein [Cyanobacteria bacterium REEB65]